MNRFKGSPAPWVLENDESSIRIAADGDEVCGLIAKSGDDILSELEWVDARLIAAAPDLLSALISCKNAMEHGDPNEELTKQVWGRIIDDAKSAINKALGEGV